MSKKTIYKTIIQFEVLSEEPIADGMTLDKIYYECEDGEYSGSHKLIIANKPLKGMNAVNAIIKHGTGLEFFNLDEKGNEIDF